MQDSIVETVKQINVARRSSLADEVVGLNNVGAGVVDDMPRAGSHYNEEEEEEEEEERLLWQINNNTMLYMISFAKETPIKTCNMSLAWEPPYYNDIIILI